MEKPGSADPNGEKVAERTWDCPGHHPGRAREPSVGGPLRHGSAQPLIRSASVDQHPGPVVWLRLIVDPAHP